MAKIIVLDTETTGFKPGQIAQLSYLVFDEKFKVLDAVNEYFKVGYMHEGAANVHGLTKELLEELSGGKEFADVANQVHTDLSECDFLIIHNADFDLNFLREELARCGVTLKTGTVICTMKHFTPICKIPGPRGMKWPKLAEALEFVGVSPELVLEKVKSIYQCEETSFHDARFDVVGLLILVYKGVQLGYITEVVV